MAIPNLPPSPTPPSFAVLRWVWREFPRASSRGGLLMGLYYRYQEGFTPLGKGLAGLLVALFFAEMMPRWSGAAPFLALGAAALLRSWVWSRAFRGARSLQLRTHLPSRAIAGEEVALDLRVVHSGTRPVSDIGALLLRLPDPIQAAEDGRWLGTLQPGEEVADTLKVRVRKRGIYVLRPPALMVSDALGLARKVVRNSAVSPWELRVHPRAIHVLSGDFLYRGDEGVEFARVLALADGEPEFLGLREYREGDEMRDIHQKAWARLGRPVVREWGRLRGGGLGLHLWPDFDRWVDRMVLEDLYRLCGGLARWLEGKRALGGFHLAGTPLPGESTDATAVLDALAALPATGPVDWDVPAQRRLRAESSLGGSGPQLHITASPRRAQELLTLAEAAGESDSPIKIIVVGHFPAGPQRGARREALATDPWQAWEQQGRVHRVALSDLQGGSLSL